MTYHVGARPEHQKWQGRVWTMEQLLQMIDAKNLLKTYNGKEYTTYEALQQQRRMETAMRKSRQDIKLLQEGGADEMEVVLKKAKYQGQMQTYKDFCKKMGLPEQKQRITQDGLRGRYMPTQKELADLQGESGISYKRYPKDGKYLINRDLITSNEYKRRYNGITGDTKVDNAIHKYAKAGLIHRDGTNYEDLYILSNKTSKILRKNISGTDSFGVKINESVINAVKENQGDLIGLHTHPDETPPTGSDFETVFKRRYNFGVAACADGSIYVYKCAEQYVSKRYIDVTIEKYKNMVDIFGQKIYPSEKEAHLAALDQLRKDYGIWYEAR